MSDNIWTEEELAALPQTTQVFNVPAINLDEHDLVQENYTVVDRCHNTSFTIEPGKTLKKEGGHYTLVNELG
jgi:hypothetical protein